MIAGLNWVQLLWPMLAAGYLALAFVQFGLWLRLRERRAHFMLAAAAAAVAAIAGFELAFMSAETPEQATNLLRWVQIPSLLLALCVAGFARYYFGSMRSWLLAIILVSRAALLGLAFARPSGAYYQRIDALETLVLPGGVRVSGLAGVASSWAAFAAATWFLLAVLVADSALQAWRRSPPAAQARILRTAAALVAFLVYTAIHSYLVRTGVLHAPYVTAPAFIIVLFMLANDLTTDLVRTSHLAESLRTSEVRLQESEMDRELAVDAAALAHWSLEVTNMEIRGSRQFRELFGLAGDPPYRLADMLERVHPADQERIHSELEAAIASRQPALTELRVRSEQSGWHWVRLVAHLFDDSPAGGATRLRGVCYETTALRLAEERFRRVVESVPSALLIVDDGGRITFANQHAVEVFGYPAQELANLELERLLPERFRDRHLGHRAGFMTRPRARPMGSGLELFGRRKDGSEFPIDVSLAPLPAEEGGLALAMISDITVRREQELASAHQRAELTHLSRVAVLGELSASLAHELNQPLAAILSNAQAAQRFMVQEPVDLAELREIIEDIVADDKRAGEVIRRLRAMLRKEELPRVPVDLNEVVRGVLKIVHSDLVNRGVTVESELAERLPAIDGDSVQLQQVLLNLIVNGCDAMAEQPRPRTLTVRTRSEADSVWTEISDRGHGISESELERIFNPFVTTKPQGTGLGLSVCRTIVTSHDGRIWARNNAAGGATLTVTLPAAHRALA